MVQSQARVSIRVGFETPAEPVAKEFQYIKRLIVEIGSLVLQRDRIVNNPWTRILYGECTGS